jgi:hypothetical protein
VAELSPLDRAQSNKFKKSQQYDVLMEIIEKYQQKSTENGQEIPLSTLL